MIFEFSAYILIIRRPQFFFFQKPSIHQKPSFLFFFPAKKLLNFDIFISPSEVIEGKQILPSLPINSLPPFFSFQLLESQIMNPTLLLSIAVLASYRAEVSHHNALLAGGWVHRRSNCTHSWKVENWDINRNLPILGLTIIRVAQLSFVISIYVSLESDYFMMVFNVSCKHLEFTDRTL